jgi:hypothetical protein
MEITRHDRIHRYGESVPLYLSEKGLQYRSTSLLGWPIRRTAVQRGVLGLMRALDSIAASEDIRTACIHPWFTGKPSPSPHSLFYFTVVAQTPASSTGS